VEGRKRPSRKPERNPVEATEDDSAKQYMAFEEALQAKADEELDVPENPENYEIAFALRAEEADRLSRELEYLGKHMIADPARLTPDEIIKVVRTVAEAWSTVAYELEQARRAPKDGHLVWQDAGFDDGSLLALICKGGYALDALLKDDNSIYTVRYFTEDDRYGEELGRNKPIDRAKAIAQQHYDSTLTRIREAA
jgi:hypothetical protein